MDFRMIKEVFGFGRTSAQALLQLNKGNPILYTRFS